MKRIKTTALVCLFLALQGFSATYYVSPDGDDLKDGLTIANAWQTIAKVVIDIIWK